MHNEARRTLDGVCSVLVLMNVMMKIKLPIITGIEMIMANVIVILTVRSKWLCARQYSRIMILEKLYFFGSYLVACDSCQMLQDMR